jgi:hypothetical protein
MIGLGGHSVSVGSTDYDPRKGPLPRHLAAYVHATPPRAEEKEQTWLGQITAHRP